MMVVITRQKISYPPGFQRIALRDLGHHRAQKPTNQLTHCELNRDVLIFLLAKIVPN